jgi:YjjG family noncanonical pyrimidine nucleotidase
MTAELNGKSVYKCVFFDLDHTLWDYETNSKETLLELYASYDLRLRGVYDFESFHERFKIVNTALWELYDRGEINSEIIRRERFKQILEHFSAYEEKLSADISNDYLHTCPKKCNLMPGAIETLNYLSDKYTLAVITNGFEEIQNTKLCSGKLQHYFKHIITSQKAGHKKPAKEIFEYAMKANSVVARQSIMIGDNLITDIGGAKNASIDTVFYNPDQISHTTEVKHEIRSLAELQNIL